MTRWEVYPTKLMTKQPCRRMAKVKWPKSNPSGMAEPCKLMELTLKGNTESKLNSLGEFIFDVCRERFSVVSRREPKQRTSHQLVIIKRKNTENGQALPLGPLSYIPRHTPPTFPFNIFPHKLREVEEIVDKARSVPATGPSGLPYKFCNNCPQVVRAL